MHRRGERRLTLVASCIALLAGPAPILAQTSQSDATAITDAVKRIDPTAFRSRIELRDEYQDGRDGSWRNLIVPRFEYAVGSTLSLRLEQALISSNSGSGATNTGFGDLLARVSWRAARGERYAAVVAGELIFHTAADAELGYGTHVVAPLAFASIDVPRLRSTVFPFIQHFHSLEENDAGQDVNWTSIKLGALTRLPNRFYLGMENHLIVDHERDEVGYTLELELGRLLTRHWAVWARPGVGIVKNGLPQVYDWNFEIGVRYLFD